MLDKTVREIMSTQVYTAERDEILFEVTARMASHNIGALRALLAAYTEAYEQVVAE